MSETNGGVELSIVVPAFNEVGNLAKLREELEKTLEGITQNYEIIVVDDGSSDGSLDLLKTFNAEDPRFCYVSFSRNFGHQPALVAGLQHSRGAAVISMDADLQHPPSLLLEMVALWKEGNEVVYTVKDQNSQLSSYRKMLMKIGYFVLNRFCGLNIGFGQSDFRLLDRKVVNQICAIPEQDMLLRGMVDWVGFKQTGVSYEVPPRFAGEAKYNFRSLVYLVINGVFGFTVLPLRIFTFGGFALALLSILYGLFIAVIGLLRFFNIYPEVAPSGWATIAAAVTFLSGVQLIGIGVLGEYIGRIYKEVKRRPMYIVSEAAESVRSLSE